MYIKKFVEKKKYLNNQALYRKKEIAIFGHK
jgi:hypothetical protein